MVDVVWDKVCQVSVLAVIPDLFVRVEFRRIRRKPLDFEPVAPCLVDFVDGSAVNAIAYNGRGNLDRGLRWICR